jgi:hypothetical protein
MRRFSIQRIRPTTASVLLLFQSRFSSSSKQQEEGGKDHDETKADESNSLEPRPPKSKQKQVATTTSPILEVDPDEEIPSFLKRQDEPKSLGRVEFSNPLSMAGVQPDEVDARFKDAKIDRGAIRATGQWSVKDTFEDETKSVSFAKIDDLDTAVSEIIADVDRAIISVDEENKFKNKLMFVHKFAKTPKHLTWKELAQEVETLDCEIDLDPFRPEELYRMNFIFVHKKSGRRQCVWSAANDISYAEGLTDLLAAVGSCLSRADVHRTIRFDDGRGVTRDFNIRKNSRYTSEVVLAFRPPAEYRLYEREETRNKWEEEVEAQGMPTWGFHPRMMDAEYRDTDDPAGTYHMVLSAHALSFVVLRALERLITRPMKDFYRPSQIARTQVISNSEDVGVTRAVLGWLGMDERSRYPHFTPLDAIQEHWFGADAPFSLQAIMIKLREMTYLKPQNPEFLSWLSVRKRETAVATRGIRAKLLGVGSSSLFMPTSYDPTINRLLPKSQQRKIKANVSIGAVFGMPDETKHIDEVRKIAGTYKLAEGGGSESTKQNSNSDDDKEKEGKK